MTECTVDSAVQADVVIKQRRAQPFFGRHPWLFAGAIDSVKLSGETPLAPGAVVRVVTHDERFIAWGLWNEASRIRVRLYSWDEAQSLDDDFWEQQIGRAVESRRRLFDLDDSQLACRLIFSESDVLSGLTVDRYGEYLLVQFTSRAMYERRAGIVAALNKIVQPKGIWLRTEKGVREAEGLEVSDGLVSGEPPPRPLFVEHQGVTFGVDVQQGQKTGWYVDQRENHVSVSRYLSGARVLDGFCFSGGFGITALVTGKAKSVTGVDSSESALQLAAENAQLNEVASHCDWIRSDVRAALEEMASQERVFDAVIIDPPRMARSRGGVERALQGYARLNEAALRVLKPHGILVTCSCSGLVSRQQFQEMLAYVSRQTRRDIRVLEALGQPADHPVIATCLETEYLKVFVCQVD